MKASRDEGGLDAQIIIPRHKSGKAWIAEAPRPAAFCTTGRDLPRRHRAASPRRSAYERPASSAAAISCLANILPNISSSAETSRMADVFQVISANSNVL